ncbi:MAG: hypothetical protein AB1640_21865 [bacterium]
MGNSRPLLCLFLAVFACINFSVHRAGQEPSGDLEAVAGLSFNDAILVSGLPLDDSSPAESEFSDRSRCFNPISFNPSELPKPSLGRQQELTPFWVVLLAGFRHEIFKPPISLL